ncbi:MAG: PQQ-dependent sugar dehydrogenase, partial [Caldilineaceae bacterium]|nr:PQQ-dependent sugar dehydrogenase [Caldilineaceae bacterium]
MDTLVGKVIRLKLTNGGAVVPADNPFVGEAGIRPEIYALGLRSPWRMTVRNSDGKIFVADVGQAHWEEVNELKPRGNYGWSARQGPCPDGQVLPCTPAPPEFTDPVMYYVHKKPGEQGSAVTAIAFYEGSAFPDKYHDLLFFADFNNNYISVAKLGHAGAFEISPFATGTGNVVDLEYYNEALYYLDIYNGTLRTIYHTDTGNTIPVALLRAEAE